MLLVQVSLDQGKLPACGTHAQDCAELVQEK